MDLKKLPYSPVRLADGNAGLVFVSGQVGIKDGHLVRGGFELQMRQAFENLKKVLEDRNLGLDNILKVTVFITRMEDFPLFNRIYAEIFAPELEPTNTPFPARSTVIASPPIPNALFEIEVIAQYHQL